MYVNHIQSQVPTLRAIATRPFFFPPLFVPAETYSGTLEASLQPGDLSVALGYFFGHHSRRRPPVDKASDGMPGSVTGLHDMIAGLSVMLRKECRIRI